MPLGNRIVAAVLRSPLHPLLSRWVVLLRWKGHRTGRTFTTPVQYARDGDALVIHVGRPDAKTWWRNFREGGVVHVLVRGREQRMHARAARDGDVVVVRCQPGT